MWRIRTSFSHLWRIRSNFSHVWQIRANSSHVWQIRSNVKVTKSELGAKNVKSVDRPEFGLVLAQLDIEESLIGKFHSIPPSSFWGNAITRKIKDGRRWPCFSTDRVLLLVLAQLDIEGNILTKILKESDQWSWRRCDNKPVNGKFH